MVAQFYRCTRVCVDTQVSDPDSRRGRLAGLVVMFTRKAGGIQSDQSYRSAHAGGERAMTGYVQVLTTVDSEEAGETLGRSIVDARLAACVQIVGPVRSLYWWEGKVDDAREWQLLMKTTAERLPELERHIIANHSYDVPEVIVTEITRGNPDYLNWISEETGRAAAS